MLGSRIVYVPSEVPRPVTRYTKVVGLQFDLSAEAWIAGLRPLVVCADLRSLLDRLEAQLAT